MRAKWIARTHARARWHAQRARAHAQRAQLHACARTSMRVRIGRAPAGLRAASALTECSPSQQSCGRQRGARQRPIRQTRAGAAGMSCSWQSGCCCHCGSG
eukprot:5271990-Pleurochrysis_carterae.AAC.1